MRPLTLLSSLALPALAQSIQLPLRFPPSYGSASPPSANPNLLTFPAPEQQLASLPTSHYTTLTHPSPHFAGMSVRIRQTEGFCDPSVRSWTGYLDVGGGARHLFFYYFESRSNPAEDPLVMWINGGPGCSSSLGLLMELGPCRLSPPTTNSSSPSPSAGKPTTTTTEPFPHSWNTNANIFFLDQPVGVGFSYADFGEKVETTEEAAGDVARFVALFLESFGELRGREVHLAGESYGGRYLPVFASAIVDQNKRAPALGLQEVNLQSVMIGNGLTDFLSMELSYYDMACTGASVAPVLDISQCVRMKRAIPRCARTAQSACLDDFSDLACTSAMLFCASELEEPLFASGLNPYDISKPCDGPFGETLCYPVTKRIAEYLNLNETRRVLGVDEAVGEFRSCSDEVGRGFSQHMDMYAPGPTYIASLLERGISVLIYVGTYDWICNWVGNLRWVEALDWRGKEAFNSVPMGEWVVEGERAGSTKGWGGLTYATVEGAGHMVPYDKPVQALEMVNRWLEKRAL